MPINLFDIFYQETYQKFKANPPARIKRKAEKQRQEREADEKRRRLNDERAAQVIIKLSFILDLFFYLPLGSGRSVFFPDPRRRIFDPIVFSFSLFKPYLRVYLQWNQAALLTENLI